MVTINPAKQLRIDNRVGSLEVGKDADVVVWTAHPLSSFAVADRVYIDGTLYHDREADARRITDLETEKTQAARHGARLPEAQQAPESLEQWMAQLDADVERFRGGPNVRFDLADMPRIDADPGDCPGRRTGIRDPDTRRSRRLPDRRARTK